MICGTDDLVSVSMGVWLLSRKSKIRVGEEFVLLLATACTQEAYMCKNGR